MSAISVVIILVVLIATALGALVGFFKKFHGASLVGVTVLLTFIINKIIGSAVKKTGLGYGIALLITVVLSLLILSLAAKILQNLFNKVLSARLQFSHYKHHDDVEEKEAYILSAVDSGDKKEYKKQLKELENIKDSAGVWGLLDRILGAVNGGLNVLVGTIVVVSVIMVFADISGLASGVFGGALASSGWTKFGKGLALDIPLITVLSLCIWSGYKGGISSVLCFLVVIGMLVGFGFASYSIVSSEACAGAVSSLANGSLLSGVHALLGDKTEAVAKIIIGVIIYLLSLVVVILVGIFLPKIVEKFREDRVFGIADGVAGAIVLCLAVTVILLVFGGISATLKDVSFMEKFTSYEKMACFGDAMYSCNPLSSVFANLPLAGWFAPVESAPEGALILLIG